MIEATPQAIKAIKTFLAEEKIQSALRIYFQTGGWGPSGLRLVLDEPKDDDEQVELDGLTFLISKTLVAQSGLVKVDFIEEGWQQGFTLSSENPLSADINAAGCGGSCSC